MLHSKLKGCYWPLPLYIPPFLRLLMIHDKAKLLEEKEDAALLTMLPRFISRFKKLKCMELHGHLSNNGINWSQSWLFPICSHAVNQILCMAGMHFTEFAQIKASNFVSFKHTLAILARNFFQVKMVLTGSKCNHSKFINIHLCIPCNCRYNATDSIFLNHTHILS